MKCNEEEQINIETRQTSWEELSISNDFLFGKVMQNPELCKELLQRILPDLDIDHVEYPELQKTIKEDFDAKGVRLDAKAFLDYVAGRPSEDTFVKKLKRAVEKAKKNRKWRHEYMTLLMRDRENRKIGMEVGILGTVSSLRDFNIPDAEIFQKIQEKYNLSPEEAERYMKTEAEA
ncbi:hypothetical protein AALA36_00960 [Lachnospiraceae bacterium 66-29]